MNKRQRFIELRAEDKSFRSIEKEIGTDRRTLARWGSEFKEEIENLKAIKLEALREEYQLTTHARIEFVGGQLKRLKEELARRDLSDIPTPKLVELVLKMSASLSAEFPPSQIKSKAEISEEKFQRKALAILSSFDPLQSPLS